MECHVKLFTDTVYFLWDASNSHFLDNCIASALPLETPYPKTHPHQKKKSNKSKARSIKKIEGEEGEGAGMGECKIN
jgi:hypothetical protein